MAKTVPPSKSEQEAVSRFERKIKAQGEASAMLDNLESVAGPAFRRELGQVGPNSWRHVRADGREVIITVPTRGACG